MALSHKEVQDAVPAHLRTAITPQFVDKLNNMAADPEIAAEFERNFVSYTKVLIEGRFKTEDYLHAVSYVTFKLLGHTNQDAFAYTFPDRIRRMTANGYDKKQISSFVSSYHKGQLVQKIMEQTLVPAFVLHQSKFHDAINVQHEIAMDDSFLPKDRVAAADSLLKHLTPPTTKEVNLNLGVKESSGMAELRQMMIDSARHQQQLAANGYSVKAIAEAPLIEGSATEKTSP